MNGSVLLRAATAALVSALLVGCVDNPSDTVPLGNQVVSSQLSPALQSTLSGGKAFAQVFAFRDTGSVAAASDPITFAIDEPFELDFRPSEGTVAYELRIIQGNSKVASAVFDSFEDGERVLSAVSRETTVESDLIANALLDRAWCSTCTVPMMRCFVDESVSDALYDAPISYHTSVRAYAKGVTAAMEAFNEGLIASDPDGKAKFDNAMKRLAKVHLAFDRRLATGGDKEVRKQAQGELEHGFSEAFRASGFAAGDVAVAAQIASEVLFFSASGLDVRVVPSALEASERLRARIIADFVGSRLMDAGVDAMTVASINSDFARYLALADEHGPGASLYIEREWLAYQMAALVAWVAADRKERSIIALLGEIEPLDRQAKGVANRFASASLGVDLDVMAMREALDDYDAVVFKRVRDASLADVIFHTSVPAHAVPKLEMD